MDRIPNILFLNFIIYILLTPLFEISNLQRIDIFIYFSTVVLALNYLQRSRLITFSIGVLSQIVLIYLVYFKTASLFSFQWLEQLNAVIQYNFSIVLSFRWEQTTEIFRTILFLNVVWMFLILAIRILDKNKGLMIVIVTTIYLAMINSMLAYDSKWLVIMTIGIGLIYIAYEKQRVIANQASLNKRYSLQWTIVAIVFSLLVTGLGYLSPKSEPSWIDPTGWLSKFNGTGIRGVAVKKIGYSADDSYLGGPFEQDETEVMLTMSSKRVYWRGESKNQYTGHGWVENKDLVKYNINLPLKDFKYPSTSYNEMNSSIEHEEIIQVVQFQGKSFPIIFVGGKLTSIDETKPEAANLIQINPLTDNIYLRSAFNKNLETYALTGTRVIIDEEQIKNSPQDTPLELALFLQLPEKLPQRVKELANSIASKEQTRYDQAKSIESYLRNNYRYETEEVPVPREEDDFVDQFLFESKQGYCDHFSSSMVVMARSVGIPARWVKGFTAGETTYSPEDGYTGVVKNKNAHSWAELYFQGIGWLPFEPTASFYMPLEYKQEEQEAVEDKIDEDRKNLKDKELLGIEDEMENDTGNSDSNINHFSFYNIIGIAAIIFILLLIVAYYLRVYLWYMWQRIRLKKEMSLRNVIISFTSSLLNSQFIREKKKRPDQTVREYFLEQDATNEEESWIEATEIFETARYSNLPLPSQWQSKIWKLWNKIIQLLRS